MIEAKAEIEIYASPQKIWSYMVRLDDWWLRSNPDEHIELTLIDNILAFIPRAKHEGIIKYLLIDAR